MSRGIGELDVIQGAVPDWLGIVVALLTQFGDVWFMVTLFGVLYLRQEAERDELLVVGGISLCGVGLYRGFKHLFALPRPDQPLLDPASLSSVARPIYEFAAHASGFGFPSGHATMATIVYFGLATVLPFGTRHRRFIVAGSLVCLVSFTRLALGVHYLVDVVAGTVLGGFVFFSSYGLLSRIPSERESLLFATAVVLNGFYLLASDAQPQSVLLFGGTVGVFVGWQLGTRDGNFEVFEQVSVPAFRLVAVGIAVGVLPGAFLVTGAEPSLLAGSALLGTVGILPVSRFQRRGAGESPE